MHKKQQQYFYALLAVFLFIITALVTARHKKAFAHFQSIIPPPDCGL